MVKTRGFGMFSSAMARVEPSQVNPFICAHVTFCLPLVLNKDITSVSNKRIKQWLVVCITYLDFYRDAYILHKNH